MPDQVRGACAWVAERATSVRIEVEAINFGSGWWPTIRKRPGHSGFFTIVAGLCERVRSEGAWSAAEIDSILWNRGREARYKALPRSRSRNTAY